uniref:HSPB1-associated protein 1 n=1 Tax=Cacopsylla melanoneura TaxID=428564 RepID=A0A8D8SX04_9HEMI
MSSVSIKISDLKSLILSSPQPLLIKNQLSNWTPLHWSLPVWFKLLEFSGNNSAVFRCGENTCSKEPHWESKCCYKNHLIEQFLHHVEEMSTNQWMYFDYKHVAECLVEEVIEQVQSPWELVGFPERTLRDTTLWIGSKGAHTPCHYDTYGCNLVAQVIGRKQWILFPPSDPGIVATQTRVPYEESSVYSGVNFVCGKRMQESSVSSSTPYIITLEPGDILLVPHRWWHYVEHLSTGLSLNTWIPLNDKKESIAYLDEWLVRYYVKNMIKNLPEEEQTILLNPNEKDYLKSENQPTCFDEITHLIRRYQETSSNPTTKRITIDNMNQGSSDCKTTTTTETCTKSIEPAKNVNAVDVDKIRPFTREQFYEFCKNKCACLKYFENETHVSEDSQNSSSVNSSQIGPCSKKRTDVSKELSSVESNSITKTEPSFETNANRSESNGGRENAKISSHKNVCHDIQSRKSTKSASNSNNNEIRSNISKNSNERRLNMSSKLGDVRLFSSRTAISKANMNTNETSSNANSSRCRSDLLIISNTDPSQKSSFEHSSKNDERHLKGKSVPEQITENRETTQKGNERGQKRVRSPSPSGLSIRYPCDSKSAKLSRNCSSNDSVDFQPMTEGGTERTSRDADIVSKHSQIEFSRDRSNLSKHSQKESNEARSVVSEAESQFKSIVSDAETQFKSIVSQADSQFESNVSQAESIISKPSQTPDVVCNHSALFEAFTHPDVIQLVRQKLLQQLEIE